MLKLYDAAPSPYAQKVKIALQEKNIPFEVIFVNVFELSADFEAKSPRRQVPYVEDEGLVIFDSTIILEYLEDKWPTPAMLPKGAAARARARMLEDLCDTYYEAINWGLAELFFFKRGGETLAPQMAARASEQTTGIQQRLARELGSKQWFNGDAFGWADLSVYPHLNNSVRYGFAPPEGSPLSAWHKRMSERPSIKRCAADVAALMGRFAQLLPAIEKGLIQREYRDHRLDWMIRTGGLDIVIEGMRKNNIRFSNEIQ